MGGGGVFAKKCLPQKKIFTEVFDRVWNSVYIDALIPAQQLGIPTLIEMSNARLPELIAAHPSRVLGRIFRKSLAQLRFTQPVDMFDEIDALKNLISPQSWDGGRFLECNPFQENTFLLRI